MNLVADTEKCGSCLLAEQFVVDPLPLGTLFALPEEVVLMILGHLKLADLGNVSKSSKGLFLLACDRRLWKAKCDDTDFLLDESPETTSEHCCEKGRFRRRFTLLPERVHRRRADLRKLIVELREIADQRAALARAHREEISTSKEKYRERLESEKRARSFRVRVFTALLVFVGAIDQYTFPRSAYPRPPLWSVLYSLVRERNHSALTETLAYFKAYPHEILLFLLAMALLYVLLELFVQLVTHTLPAEIILKQERAAEAAMGQWYRAQTITFDEQTTLIEAKIHRLQSVLTRLQSEVMLSC